MQPTNPQRSPQGGPSRPQFFDVVRPGRTPAGPGARPVLASNSPPVPDNSMKASAPPVPAGLKSTQPTPTPPQPAPKPQPVMPAEPIPAVALSTPEKQDVGKAAVDSQVAPESEPMFVPDTDVQAPVNVQKPQEGKHSIWSEVFAVLAIILLIAIIVNILLDADVINLPLPHTNFFDY